MSQLSPIGAQEWDGAVAAQALQLPSMMSTAELDRRPSRPPDHKAENDALIALAKEFATYPDGILQKLAETALRLCRAHSAGLSLLEDADQRKNFHWRALAGHWSAHLGGGTPRDFGPCGTVLDRNTALLCSRPERDFPYFGEVTPPCEEALLVPFHVHGEAVGTIWVVAHDTSRCFDKEDLRVLTNLGAFAAAAYQAIEDRQDRGRVEQELHETIRHSTAVLSALPEAVYTTDADGRLTYYNDAAAEFWGYRPELGDARWCGSWRLFRPDGSPLPYDECPMAVAIKEARPVRGVDAIAERPDGTRVPFLAFPTPLHDASGKVIGAVNMLVDITERKRTQEQITLLAREAEHRSKNVLATVQAMVHLTNSDTLEGFKHAVQGRIQALANVHRLFVGSRWAGADLHGLVEDELAAYSQEGDKRVYIDGPRILLEPGSAQAIAVSLHELVTNAAKYGALSVPEGKVELNWSQERDKGLVLRWIETDGPLVTTPTHQGFGSRVMGSMMRGQAKGEIRFDWRAEGLRCEITLPL